mgnify:CR=1 FL=1|tara:strand:+ start:1633 stop:2190 length:558 start_codon:yes stop_codon:yes gene_type:complete
MKNKKQPTEGELFILEYLKYNKIDFKREVKLTHLKNDNLSCRIADFYLPKYKVHIEFNGMWNNSKEDRIRYREKKKIYENNYIPCVYLYPENLGVIEFVFPKRLIEQLTFHSMKKELLKFQLKRFIDDRGSLFLWLFIAVLFLAFNFDWQEDKAVTLIFLGMAGFQVYRLIVGYYNFFIINKHKF